MTVYNSVLKTLEKKDVTIGTESYAKPRDTAAGTMTIRITGINRLENRWNNRKIRKNLPMKWENQNTDWGEPRFKIYWRVWEVRNRTGMRRGHKVSHHQSALLIIASTLITTPRMVNDAQDFTHSGYLYINRNYPFWEFNRSRLYKHTIETTDFISPKDEGQ